MFGPRFARFLTWRHTDETLQLTREYQTISENPPPYITAHPSESNILEYVSEDVEG
jgi:hypothetical protein